METYNEALRRQHTQQGFNLWNFNRVNSVATLQPIRQNITVVVCDAATMHEHLSELKSSVRTTPHAPLGPTHPRKCSVSPRQKTAPSLHASTSSVTDPVNQPPPPPIPPPSCCMPPPDAHTQLWTQTCTCTHNGCLNGKPTPIYSVTALNTHIIHTCVCGHTPVWLSDWQAWRHQTIFLMAAVTEEGKITFLN